MEHSIPQKTMPLPAKISDFIAQRKGDLQRTLNDQVEEVHLALYQDDSYRQLLAAVYDEQAVEGSLAADNVMAAMRIRKWASDKENPVAREKLATISKSLGVVLRRYRASRKDRRNMLGGEIVEGNNGD